MEDVGGTGINMYHCSTICLLTFGSPHLFSKAALLEKEGAEITTDTAKHLPSWSLTSPSGSSASRSAFALRDARPGPWLSCVKNLEMAVGNSDHLYKYYLNLSKRLEVKTKYG